MPKVMQVIQSEVIRGDGHGTVLRKVVQYHTMEGELLAENDPCPNDKVAKPTIEELERLLQREDDTPVMILPNGEVRALHA